MNIFENRDIEQDAVIEYLKPKKLIISDGDKLLECPCAKNNIKPKRTNYDKITSSVEILAEYIEKSQLCPDTIHLGNENLLNECKVYKDTGTCKECILEWLQKECDNGK